MTDNVIRCPKCSTRNRIPVVASGRPRCGTCKQDLPWLVDVSTREFDSVIGQSTVPVLVDLWAPWCAPCRMIAPALEQLAAHRAGTLRVAKVNVDAEPSVSARLGVQGIPTMVIYRGGEEVARQVGAMPADRIERWVDTALASQTAASRSRPAAESS